MGRPGGIKGRLSCGVCSGSWTEQWKSGEDLLQVRYLTRYALGDGEGDNLGRTVEVSDHAARFRSGDATAIGTQDQLDLLPVDRVNGPMLTEHSPPTVVMRAGSSSWMIASALRSC